MKQMLAGFLTLSILASFSGVAQESSSLNPKIALQRLLEGNQRFVDDKLEHCDYTQKARMATQAQQRPFAIILGCSDSRVPPELLFDQGIGELFVVRVAGNVLGLTELDSIEYSVLYNKSVLIVVLGHENCGAVTAVMANKTEDIESVASLIKPNIRDVARGEPNSLENAVKANVRANVTSLKQSEQLAKYIQSGNLDIVGAYYSFSTGKVEILNGR